MIVAQDGCEDQKTISYTAILTLIPIDICNMDAFVKSYTVIGHGAFSVVYKACLREVSYQLHISSATDGHLKALATNQLSQNRANVDCQSGGGAIASAVGHGDGWWRVSSRFSLQFCEK